MNHHKRRFRPRQQKGSFRRRGGASVSNNNGHFQGSNGNASFVRNGSMTNPFNVEKVIQKYQQLAKDAQSSGDPVLVENYLQHADHFTRKLYELNIDKSKNSSQTNNDNSKESSQDIRSEDLK